MRLTGEPLKVSSKTEVMPWEETDIQKCYCC